MKPIDFQNAGEICLLIHVLSEAELDSVEIHHDNPEAERPEESCCVEVRVYATPEQRSALAAAGWYEEGLFRPTGFWSKPFRGPSVVECLIRAAIERRLVVFKDDFIDLEDFEADAEEYERNRYFMNLVPF